MVQDINGKSDKKLDFKIDKDFILKSFLFMLDKPVAFKIKNFDSKVIKQIEDNFYMLRNGIYASFKFLSDVGFNKTILSSNLSSNFSATVIAYYLYKSNLLKVPKEERVKIRLFVVKSLLKGIYSGSHDNVLVKVRTQ